MTVIGGRVLEPFYQDVRPIRADCLENRTSDENCTMFENQDIDEHGGEA